MKNRYISIGEVEYYFDTSCKKDINARLNEAKNIGDIGDGFDSNALFVRANGAYYVRSDYKKPLCESLETLYFKCLATAKSEHNLSEHIALMSGKKKDTVYHYLHRFTFKHAHVALEYVRLLDDFLVKNSLFGTQLEY